MWKEFSRDYLARNRASAVTVAAAALAAAFFLALIGSLFYNLWAYDIERVIQQEGGWQARVTVTQNGADLDHTLAALRQFANVASAELNPQASDPEQNLAVIDLMFTRKGEIYTDLDRIRSVLALPGDAVTAHDTLLSLYLVTDPQDLDPPLLLPFYLAVLAAAAAALVLLIRNSFAITMQARLHQFGILASIGATPRQIRLALLQESAVLSALPLALGAALGFAACWGIVQAVNAAAADVAGRQAAVFRLHPLLAAALLVLALGTVLLSAWLPARRLSRMTPLEALRGGPPDAPRRRYRPARLLRLCFGIRGELAGAALRARRKSLRIANLSLTLSFLAFTAMLCFFTLSGISTDMTYFARYRDAWDVMAVVEDTSLTEFSLTAELQALPGVADCAVYEKAETSCLVPPDSESGELRALGGLAALTGEAAAGNSVVAAPILVLDDDAFARYCGSVGLDPEGEGAVLVNRVWDSVHSSFRDRRYLPFLRADTSELTLAAPDGTPLGTLPLLGTADTPPNLREEYDDYTLVQVWPLRLWQRLAPAWGLAGERQVCIRLLGAQGITPEACEQLQQQVEALLTRHGYAYTVENRPGEQRANDQMLAGMQMILGGLCLLLAAIGLANVFLNTLGFVGQRRREFARCLAIGMTPRELRSLFVIEAAALAGRPLLVTLPLTALAVGFMLGTSGLDPAVFLARAPFGPVAAFALLIVAAVALAYFLGARRTLQADLTEILKDDSLR